VDAGGVATRKKSSQKGVEELKAEMAKPRAAKSAQRRLVLIDNFEGTNAAYARADFQKHVHLRGGRRWNRDGLKRSTGKESSHNTFARNAGGSGELAG
jgi:hypothetical protein